MEETAIQTSKALDVVTEIWSCSRDRGYVRLSEMEERGLLLDKDGPQGWRYLAPLQAADLDNVVRKIWGLEGKEDGFPTQLWKVLLRPHVAQPGMKEYEMEEALRAATNRAENLGLIRRSGDRQKAIVRNEDAFFTALAWIDSEEERHLFFCRVASNRPSIHSVFAYLDWIESLGRG